MIPLLLLYVYLPFIVVAALFVAAIIVAIVWPKSLFATAPAMISVLTWGYVEHQNGHWQVDELCQSKAGVTVYERMQDVRIIHRDGDECRGCYSDLKELGYGAIEFTTGPTVMRGRDLQPNTHYRASFQPTESAKCDPLWRSPAGAPRCVVIEQIPKITAALSVQKVYRSEKRFLGKIRIHQKRYVRTHDQRLIAEENWFEWISSGVLANHTRSVSMSGRGFGEFVCTDRPGHRNEEILDFARPANRP